jgi:hypothetical protein
MEVLRESYAIAQALLKRCLLFLNEFSHSPFK